MLLLPRFLGPLVLPLLLLLLLLHRPLLLLLLLQKGLCLLRRR